MEIRRVNIEDVFPVEDAMGNQYLSRDYSLKANQDYVRDLAASFGPDGEPDEPPVLVEDGGIYRIKSGNSRIMAMRELGTKIFTAIIDDRDTPKSLVEAAIRTDTKKTYEPIERSRYEQQLFLFGPDEYVSEVTGRPVEHVRKARRTIETVEDAAADMTIERMIALADFEDDAEAYQRIANAPEKDWRKVADNFARKRADREAREAVIAALEMRGAHEGDTEGLQYFDAFFSASRVPDELPEGSVYKLSEYNNSVALYAPANGEVDDEKEAEKQCADELKALWEKSKESREAWIVEHINDDLPGIIAITDESPYDYRVNGFLRDHEIELPKGPADAIYAYKTHSRQPFAFDELDDDADLFIALTDAMKADGYEPPEEEMRLYEMCQEYMAGDDDE